MAEHDEILAELRKISSWVESQRRMGRWVLMGTAIFAVVMIGFGVVIASRGNSAGGFSSSEKADWSEVDRQVRAGEADGAITLGAMLIAKSPGYGEGHRKLAMAYLAAGRPEQARVHFAEAYRIFPSEENAKALVAIDQRISTEAPATNAEANPAEHRR